MAKSLTLGPILARSAQSPTPLTPKKLWVLHLLAVVTHGSKLSSYAISRKTNELQKMTKNLILGPIMARLAQIWAPHFF